MNPLIFKFFQIAVFTLTVIFNLLKATAQDGFDEGYLYYAGDSLAGPALSTPQD